MSFAVARPFDDVRALLAQMPGPSQTCVEIARARNAQLVKPPGGLGRLEDIVEWLAAWQGRSQPVIARPTIVLFAGAHGLAAQGLAAWPPTATRQMLETFAAGGGAVNQVAATYGLGFKVFDLALDIPTADISREAALDEKAAAATFAFGMEAIAGGVDLLCLGALGVGGNLIAAAICAALHGGDPGDWMEPEPGVDEAGRQRARAALARALALHRAHCEDPLEVLRRLGGREFWAIAGAIVAARIQRVPVILDGMVATAAAAILQALDASALDHCLAGHVAPGRAHRALLTLLGKPALLDLGVTLQDGVGAGLAAGIVKAALACHADMATFEQAGVTI